MFSNRFAFVALGVACIAAAGAGGYLASRQNQTPAAVTVPAATASTAATTPDRPVQETEAVVRDTPPAASTPSAATTRTTAAAATAKREKAPARNLARETKSAQAGAPQQAALPTLDRSWPSGAGSTSSPAAPIAPSSPPAPAGPSTPDTSASTARADEHAAQEPARAPEPPAKTFEELVVSADSVIGLQTETPLTSERARVEDRVEARVTRDVKVGDKVAVPAGARALGSVTLVDRGGKFKERARLGIRFHTLVLADGTQLPITTETIYRDGVAPGNESAAKIGGAAVGGAILGAILGGAKGAVIGATTGAGAGTAVVANGDRNAATLPAGTPMTVRIVSPVSVTIEK